jgi:hypothetical protein
MSAFDKNECRGSFLELSQIKEESQEYFYSPDKHRDLNDEGHSTSQRKERL